MSIDRKRSKGNSDFKRLGPFFALPIELLLHPNWTRLSPHGVKLVVDLGRQYNGSNNGFLCAAWEVMKDFGWRSRETLAIAIAEVEHYGLAQRTRQGGRNRPNLYALTWQRINAKQDDTLDVAQTLHASGQWKERRAVFEAPGWLAAKRQRDRDREAAKRVTRSAARLAAD